jgi:glycosyltransferase involved in cell wall biosynthesis
MNDACGSRVLVFSEEYTKVTKGMFAVWTNYAREAARSRQVAVLLNHEHWAFVEASAVLRTDDRIEVKRLAFDMPSTWLRRVLPASSSTFVTRALSYVLGEALDLALSPVILLSLYLRLRRIRPTALFSHSGGWPAGALCRWIIYAARLAQVRERVLVIHSHPSRATNRLASMFGAPVGRLQARAIGSCATAIVTVSDTVRTVLESETFHRPVVRIYNGIDPCARAGGSVSSRPLTWRSVGLGVGFVGALSPMKGAHVLLDAFRLVRVRSELALLGPAVGPQDYIRSLEERAGRCVNRVSFLGFHDDVDGFLERIDLLVVPSVAYESFGMVILEAMKHGKPVICSDFGGMKEVVQHGVTGLVVPAGDVAALADALDALLPDADRRRLMGAAGYRRLKMLFTSERMAQQYDSLIGGQ